MNMENRYFSLAIQTVTQERQNIEYFSVISQSSEIWMALKLAGSILIKQDYIILSPAAKDRSLTSVSPIFKRLTAC